MIIQIILNQILLDFFYIREKTSFRSQKIPIILSVIYNPLDSITQRKLSWLKCRMILPRGKTNRLQVEQSTCRRFLFLVDFKKDLIVQSVNDLP